MYGNVSVCYSGDTRPNAELLKLCRGADLMILGMIGPFKSLAALTPTSQRLARTAGQITEVADRRSHHSQLTAPRGGRIYRAGYT